MAIATRGEWIVVTAVAGIGFILSADSFFHFLGIPVVEFGGGWDSADVERAALPLAILINGLLAMRPSPRETIFWADEPVHPEEVHPDLR